MKIGLLLVGREWVEGRKEPKTAHSFARALTTSGHQLLMHQTIAPEKEQLKKALKQMEGTCEAIFIFSGEEDKAEQVVKEFLGAFLEKPLVLNESIHSELLSFYQGRDEEPPMDLSYQAVMVEGAEPLVTGTLGAVGMGLEKEEMKLVYLPAMEPLPEDKERTRQSIEKVMTFLTDKQLASSLLKRTYYFFGITKTKLQNRLETLKNEQPDLKYLLYEQDGEWVVDVSVPTDSKETLQEIQKEWQTEWAATFIGQDPLSVVVSNLLKEKNLTITAAESLTSGAFMSYLSSEPEAGTIFEGGMVSYSPRIKQEVLQVDSEIIERCGVVSSECAEAMAENAQRLYHADVGVSLTGAAGPASLEGNLPGTVWIGLSRKNERTQTKKFVFPYGRNQNRRYAVLAAANLVRQVLTEIDQTSVWEAEE